MSAVASFEENERIAIIFDGSHANVNGGTFHGGTDGSHTILGFDETRIDRRMVIILKSSLLFGAVTTESRH
jgi:hypothetical protein